MQLQTQTLAGDVRDFLLEYVRKDKNPLPWNMRTEDQQREAIRAATEASHLLLERVVELVAADGRETIIGQLSQFLVKDGIKAVIVLPSDDATLLAVSRLRHGKVIIALADASLYDGERKPANAEPNDPGLPFDQAGDPGPSAEDINDAIETADAKDAAEAKTEAERQNGERDADDAEEPPTDDVNQEPGDEEVSPPPTSFHGKSRGRGIRKRP